MAARNVRAAQILPYVRRRLLRRRRGGGRALGGADPHGLNVREFVNAEVRKLASVAAVFDAAER